VVEITKSREGNKVLCSVNGRIDTQTAPDLQDEIHNSFIEAENELENKMELILDFKNVSYMSSAGLRTILHTKKKIDSMAGSSLRIINVQAPVMEIFDMTGFTDFLDLSTEE